MLEDGRLLPAEMALSVVVPMTRGSAALPILTTALPDMLAGLDYEVIVVDSGDEPAPELLQTMLADAHVRWVTPQALPANAGRAQALLAGIERAGGEYIAVLAGPLEHAVPVLSRLLAESGGADLLVAVPPAAHAVTVKPIGGSRQSQLAAAATELYSRGESAVTATLFARARACSQPLSAWYVAHRSLFAGEPLTPTGDTLLPEVLVRTEWQRLIEVPIEDLDRTAISPPVPLPALFEEWRTLRTGNRAHGVVRTARAADAVREYDPLPLDEELPEAAPMMSQRGKRLLWMIGIFALVLRLLLLPLGHWWDMTTDYNTFIDLAKGASPYDTLGYLTNIARSAQWDTVYQYWAYPPAALYIYFPFAKLFHLLHPQLTYYIPVEGSSAMPTLPLDFYLWLKLPIWTADFLIAALLARMTGTIRGWRDYLVNPYVLLISGAWTFDAIMVLGLVAGAYYLQRGKLGRAGMALAFGTMVKFIPAIAVPTILLYMIKRRRPLREMVLFTAAYGVTCLVLLGPYLKGLLYVLSFHSGRVGGGMNWQVLWELPVFFHGAVNLQPIQMAIGAFGMPTLGIVMLLAYWYAYTREMSFNRMMIVTVLGFLIGSKLVNEQYALTLLPFLMIEAVRSGGAWRWFTRAFWIIPLGFAIFNVPIDRFLWLFYHTFLGTKADAIAATRLTGFESPFIPWKHHLLDPLMMVLFGFGFFALCVVVMLWPPRTYRAPRNRFWRSPAAYFRPALTAAAVGSPVTIAGNVESPPLRPLPTEAHHMERSGPLPDASQGSEVSEMPPPSLSASGSHFPIP